MNEKDLDELCIYTLRFLPVDAVHKAESGHPGLPPGEAEVELTKKTPGWPLEPAFHVPEQALEHFRRSLSRAAAHQDAWEALFRDYGEKHPDRVVSLPSCNLFSEQPDAYRKEVFPDGIPIVAIEAGVSVGWKPYIGPAEEVAGVDRFGASTSGDRVMSEYGFTVENTCSRVVRALNGKER